MNNSDNIRTKNQEQQMILNKQSLDSLYIDYIYHLYHLSEQNETLNDSLGIFTNEYQDQLSVTVYLS